MTSGFPSVPLVILPLQLRSSFVSPQFFRECVVLQKTPLATSTHTRSSMLLPALRASFSQTSPLPGTPMLNPGLSPLRRISCFSPPILKIREGSSCLPAKSTNSSVIDL